MILPGSYFLSLALLVLSMLCWGLWPGTYKTNAKKWRFELYYLDFAFGAVIAALLLGLTLGSFGFDGFSFTDDLRLAGKRQDLFAFLGGAVFNLGNMLLLGAISVSGISVAFPIGLGLAMFIEAIWIFGFKLGGSLMFLLFGLTVTVVTIVVTVLAWRTWSLEKYSIEAREGKSKSTKKEVSSQAMTLSLLGGLLLGNSFPFIQIARTAENGLGPYSAGFVVAVGVFVSTIVYSLFFMNLPVQGQPVEMAKYFAGRFGTHLKGYLGGAMWYAGLLVTFVVFRTEGAAQVPTAISYPLAHGAAFLGAVLGIVQWKELETSTGQIKTYLGLVLLFLLISIGVFSAGIYFNPA